MITQGSVEKDITISIKSWYMLPNEGLNDSFCLLEFYPSSGRKDERREPDLCCSTSSVL